MTDRCGGVGTERAWTHASEESSCEPSAEQLETKRQEANQATGDRRRDEWIAGMSRGAASVPAGRASCEGSTADERARDAAAQRSRDMHMASAAHTKPRDLPLKDDPVGNAIPGLVAGGIVAGGSAIASGALTGTKAVVVAVGKHLAEEVVTEGVQLAAEHGAHALRGHEGAADASAPSMAAPAVTTPAGRSGPRAVSEPVRQPAGKSEPAPPAGRDAIPYLPGHAPGRIPEALGPVSLMVKG